jgi:predicted nucleic acid-binding protein
MRIALDTNVPACAEGANGAIRCDQTLKLIERLPAEAVVLPAQALGELFNVLVRKAKRRPARTREAVLSRRDAYAVVDTSAAVNTQCNGSGVRSWPYDLGLGDAGRVGGGRVSFASVGRFRGGVYMAGSHRDQPVCGHTSSLPEGPAYAAGQVSPQASGTGSFGSDYSRRLRDPLAGRFCNGRWKNGGSTQSWPKASNAWVVR